MLGPSSQHMSGMGVTRTGRSAMGAPRYILAMYDAWKVALCLSMMSAAGSYTYLR